MGQDIFRILSLFIINLIVSSKYSDQQPPSQIIRIYYCVYSLNRKLPVFKRRNSSEAGICTPHYIMIMGTLVLQGANADYRQLFSTSDLLSKLKFYDPSISNFEAAKCVVTTNNGDGNATATHFYAPEWWGSNNAYYQYFYPGTSSPIRVNYCIQYLKQSGNTQQPKNNVTNRNCIFFVLTSHSRPVKGCYTGSYNRSADRVSNRKLLPERNGKWQIGYLCICGSIIQGRNCPGYIYIHISGTGITVLYSPAIQRCGSFFACRQFSIQFIIYPELYALRLRPLYQIQPNILSILSITFLPAILSSFKFMSC